MACTLNAVQWVEKVHSLNPGIPRINYDHHRGRSQPQLKESSHWNIIIYCDYSISYHIILYYIMSYHIIIIYIYIISIILPILKFPSYSCPNTPIIPFEIHHFWAETSQDRSDKRPTSTISVTRRLYSLRFSDLGRWWSEIVLGCAGDLGVI